jgi:hypothetical protein
MYVTCGLYSIVLYLMILYSSLWYFIVVLVVALAMVTVTVRGMVWYDMQLCVCVYLCMYVMSCSTAT